MLEMLLIGVIASALLVILTAMFLWRSQRRTLKAIQAQQQAWQRAQEVHQQQWQVTQEKLARELDRKLAEQIQQLHNEWEAWEEKDTQRVEELARQYHNAEQRSRVEHELARLPYVEDMPVIQDDRHPWRPPQLRGTNLSHRDLSHRYLGKADLRNANLAYANLFMADLSNASLAGANLTGADLSGANLTNTDLHNATLVEANLLVTDLNDALLMGANLLGVRSLTMAQLYTATYDDTTQINLEIDITLPRTPSLRVNSDELSTPHGREMATDSELQAITLPATPLETPFAQSEVTPVDEPAASEPKIEEQQEEPVSAPPPSDDSPVPVVKAGPQEDTSENKRIEVAGTTPPKRRRNGKKTVKAN